MTTYNIVYINNVNKYDYGKLPEKKKVWVEHLVPGSFCIRVFSSKESVIDSWKREYQIDDSDVDNRIYTCGDSIYLRLKNFSEAVIRKAVQKVVED